MQGSDQEHGEEEAVRGQQSPHFLRVPKETREEKHRVHDAGPGRSHHGLCYDLAGCRGDRNAEQPLDGPTHQETEDSRWDV